MDATERCAWCGKDATHTLTLQPGSSKGAKRIRLPKTARVCTAHYAQFTAADEIGDRGIGDDW